MQEPSTPPTAKDLFFAFLGVGASGFGGVLVVAHRMLVDGRRWLSEQEFVDTFSLSQFLPGPNIVNLTVLVGRRFAGLGGAVAATAGVVLAPFVIIIALAALVASLATVPGVSGALNGVAAGAAGLIFATGLRMARTMKGCMWQLAATAVVFAAIVCFQASLWSVVVAAIVPLLLTARATGR